MFRKLQVAAILLCMLSYAAAGTVSIGTVSARGDMRVDNYAVKGNATLFEGSVVETGKASADLRLDKGTQITLSSDSRGTLYRDHLVLQQGETEVASANPFQLEANGVVRVTANQPNSRGIVTVMPGNTIQVATLSGSFGVTNEHGVLVANVQPGRVVSFAIQAGANPIDFSGVGLVSFENGTYYLTTDENVKYVLTCKDPHAFVKDKVIVTGTISGAPRQNGNAAQSLCVKTMDINGNPGMSEGKKWLIAGLIVGGAAALGIALAIRNNNPPSASR